jgi:hypothetical protein
MATNDHDGGLVGDSLRRRERSFDRIEVFSYLASLDDMPPICGESLRRVVGQRELGGSIYGDVVVVIDEGQSSEPEVAGETCRLVAEPLRETAIAGNTPGVVIADLGTEALAQ